MHNDKSIKVGKQRQLKSQKKFDPYKCAFLVGHFLKESAASYVIDLDTGEW